MANKMFISIDWRMFRKLAPTLQQAWIYGWTNCDAAGIFEFDEDYAKIDLGRKISEVEFEKLSEFGVVKIAAGTFVFTEYIFVNYVTLKPDYNPHKPVYRALQKFRLSTNDKKTKIDISSLVLACGKLEDKDEDKEEEEDKEEKQKSENLKNGKKVEKTLFEKAVVMPWESPGFSQAWERWKKFKQDQHNFKFKSIDSEQLNLNNLAKISEGDEKTAIYFIDFAIMKTWKGLFKPNENQQTNGSSVNSTIGKTFIPD